MKHALKWAAFGVCLAVPAFLAFGDAPGIVNSDHDFSSNGWSGGEICVVCHTPHHADTSVTDAPLWNHTVTSASYTLYTGPGTLDATDLGQPTGVSKLCLSCHDGTVAIDSFGGATGSNFVSGDELIGTDLSQHHPIAFTYDAALATADGELFDPTTTASGITGSSGNIDDDMLFGSGNDQMECASCHDVHNKEGNDELLRIDNAGSALCLTCHDK